MMYIHTQYKTYMCKYTQIYLHMHEIHKHIYADTHVHTYIQKRYKLIEVYISTNYI